MQTQRPPLPLSPSLISAFASISASVSPDNWPTHWKYGHRQPRFISLQPHGKDWKKEKKKNHCSSPSVPVRKGKDPDWPMWVVFLGMGRSCDRGRVNEPGSGLVTCPSLWPRRETGRHPPVLTEVEIKPLPKDKDCCYQKAGRRRAWANSTHPLCYFSGEKQVMQGHIIIFYVRYLQQQTSLPPQAWKSEDKDLTPDGIFYLSPNNFWEVEQVHHPS